MNYIILDMEWNQPMDAKRIMQEPFPFSSEIIEIGAVKCNENMETLDEFKVFIRPRFYPRLNGIISRLTKIRSVNLQEAPYFPQAYRAFLDWCGEDFCFCTWGPDDMPVLLDNLVMNRRSTENFPLCYDLQHIFAMEVLKENRQMALETAMELLSLPSERAHDALNDAKNTADICRKTNLKQYLPTYPTRYVEYKAGRLNGLIAGNLYPTLEAARKDRSFSRFPCPHCGEEITLDGFRKKSATRMLGLGICSCGKRYLASCRHGKPFPGKSVRVARALFEMSPELEEIYKSC